MKKSLRDTQNQSLLHLVAMVDTEDVMKNDSNLLGQLISRGLTLEDLDFIEANDMVLCFCCMHDGRIQSHFDNIVIKHHGIYMEFPHLDAFVDYLDQVD